MENKLRCLIVDDEAHARHGLREYVEDVDFLALSGIAENAAEAARILVDDVIDLMFLDIQMPKMNGIDFMKGSKGLPKTILTTAYSEYAVEGFDLNVVDYLLKPISFKRFYKACCKAKEMHYISEGSSEDYFFVKTNKRYEAIRRKDILFVKAMQNYVVIHTADRNTVAHITLREMESMLYQPLFMKVHKSYIIAVAHIEAISREEISMHGHRIPVGRMYSDHLIEELVASRLLRR